MIVGLQFFVKKQKFLKIYRRVMICKIMLSCFFFFSQLDILRLGYSIDRCRVVWHFGAVLDL